jgi:hypothetical protein
VPAPRLHTLRSTAYRRGRARGPRSVEDPATDSGRRSGCGWCRLTRAFVSPSWIWAGAASAGRIQWSPGDPVSDTRTTGHWNDGGHHPDEPPAPKPPTPRSEDRSWCLELERPDGETASPSGAVAHHPGRVGQAYERHRPEETLLYRTLQAHWRTFLSDLESDGDSSVLPAFVVAEVEAFLRCGILSWIAPLGRPARRRSA